MRIGIVGAGFAGLTCAYRLSQSGDEVSVFEASSRVGGLAQGFTLPGWEWPLEKFYHHLFSNDSAIIRLSQEVGWPAVFYRPSTAIFSEGRIYPFDAPRHLLAFPELAVPDRLRMGTVLAFLKFFPFWKPLERITADEFLTKSMGPTGYEKIWKPLLLSKFGKHYRDVNAAWFWARIHKRTPRLGYFRRGFQGLADCLQQSCERLGARFFLDCPVREIRPRKGRLTLSSARGVMDFDRVVVTANTHLFLQATPGLPREYAASLQKLAFLDALVVVLVVRKQVLPDCYWLNIIDPKHPFVAVIEHTNMVDSAHYNGQHIVYLGTYLSPDHPSFSLKQEEVSAMAVDELAAINSAFRSSDVVERFVFRGRGAQPVIPVDYSSRLPTMETPIPNLFLANMSLVYPWDRGTNYAVELGERAAARIKGSR